MSDIYIDFINIALFFLFSIFFFFFSWHELENIAQLETRLVSQFKNLNVHNPIISS